MVNQLVKNNEGRLVQKSNGQEIELNRLDLKLVKNHIFYQNQTLPEFIDAALIKDSQSMCKKMGLDYFFLQTSSIQGIKLDKVESPQPSIKRILNTHIRGISFSEEQPPFPDYRFCGLTLITVNFYSKK